MDLSTYSGRVQRALELRNALRRAPGDSPSTGELPRGDCGRDPSEECGMKDENECRAHADPPDSDPALLNYSGTLASRKRQLKAARRDLLRR